jgi:polyhydroxybutyrate depolymerase
VFYEQVQQRSLLEGTTMSRTAKVRWPFALVSIFTLVVVHHLAGLQSSVSSAASSNHADTITVGGLSRSYFVHLPPGYDGHSPLPLVLVLHGATESPEGVEHLSGMSAEADKEHFIAAYPRGTGHLLTWNSGACCGYAMQHQIDDVAFLRSLIGKLEQDYSVDAKRIFATGISNGGMMSYRLACELSDKIAAIAPVEGAQDVPCHPANPVSIIIFHGTADHLVPYGGGSTPFQIGSKRSDTSVAETLAFWVKENSCAATPTHSATDALHTVKYSDCASGRAVELYAIQGGHHMWPSAVLSGNSVAATDLMWSFFAEHPKP